MTTLMNLEAVPVIDGFRTLIALVQTTARDNNRSQSSTITIEVGDILRTTYTQGTNSGEVFFEVNGNQAGSTYHPFGLNTRHPYDLGQFDTTKFMPVIN